METTDKTELSILSEISRISNSYVDLPEKLSRIVQVVARGMGKDGASVFLIDRPGKTVTLTAAVGLNQETVGKLNFPIGMGIAGWVAEQKVPLALEDPYSDPRFQYIPESGIERFKSLVAAPIMDEDRCFGVIFVLSLETWRATSSELTLLITTANQVSGVIKSTRLFHTIQQRLSELATIYEIGMALTSTLDLEQLLSLIARNSTQSLRAQGCTIRLMNLPEIISRKTYASFGLTGNLTEDMDARIGGAVAERVAREKKPLLIQDVSRDDLLAAAANGAVASMLSIPLIFHDRVIGVITLYNKQDERSFTEDDLQFLTTVASSAAVAVENAAMYERMEELATEARTRAQELSILYDIGTAMSTTLNLDRLLRIILTATTMGGSGLGFNQAMLLLTNERTNTLQGMMGVGPANWEEAGRAWNEVATRHRSLMEWIQTGDLFEHRDSALNTMTKGIRVPLEAGEGVLALTVLNKRAYNIVDAGTDRLVPSWLRDTLRVKNFATVPLVAKDRVIGIIIVDNMFNQRPITENDLRFLTMFANQAALAIENAIIHSNLEMMNKDMRALHEQLVQSEKMAALGAMIAEITHEIRNPLVSIGGFTRRLAKKLQSGEDKKYIDIILNEVSRLEAIIHDNLSYIKEVAPQLSEGDLNHVAQDILTLYEDELAQRRITVVKDLAKALPPLAFDQQQMKQAVINIIKNAMEAMENGGTLTISTSYLPETNEEIFEIGDTGHGISAKAMHNVFNPYYTTKPRGTGLGLPITNRIVKAHGGRIEMRNKSTGGAVFTIKLPRGGSGGRET
ncbi:MAG TPA: GAF domain-containing protein [Nitrospirota bacterium]|nr:GAF domain-containing protein [Nitrospirota bacterium]